MTAFRSCRAEIREQEENTQTTHNERQQTKDKQQFPFYASILCSQKKSVLQKKQIYPVARTGDGKCRSDSLQVPQHRATFAEAGVRA